MANVRLTHSDASGSITVREDQVPMYEGQGWSTRSTSSTSTPAPRKRASKKATAKKTAEPSA